MEEIKTFLQEYSLYEYAWSLAKAIIILVVGLWVIRILSGAFKRMLNKRNVDESLKPFLRSLFKNTLIVLLVLSVLGVVGIPMTSFVAIVGAAGLAVGLALQGTLQNFAGGVIILILRPFRVGDFIEGSGLKGVVQEIQIFNTILLTPDNIRIVIPNGKLSNENILNYSVEEKRRIDLVFGIGYEDDIKKAKEVMMNVLKANDKILEDPAPQVALSELADSSVNFVVRPWVQSADYWDTYFEVHEAIKLALDEEGISIPFPQRDVHLYKTGTEA